MDNELTPKKLHAYMLKRAYKGDKEQARHNLAAIAKDLEKDQLEGSFREWLILALRDISAGQDANEIFMLNGRQGKNPDKEDKRWQQDFKIYQELVALKERRPTLGINGAADVLRRNNYKHLTSDAIRKAYRRIVDGSNSFAELFPKR